MDRKSFNQFEDSRADPHQIPECYQCLNHVGSGKKCFSGIMKSNTDRFQIENAKSGVYYVKITGKNLYEIKKIIVE